MGVSGNISARDRVICGRIRQAREFLGITQKECAEQIGLERGTLVNYESGRSPLRVNVALRFCRTLILSEEWLATGAHEFCHESAKAHGQGWDATVDKLIFRRQCMDLLSDPASIHIPPSMLLSEAWSTVLAPAYQAAVLQFFYNPRISFHETDKPDIGINLLKALNERYVLLLTQEAMRLRKSENTAWRTYVRCIFEASEMVFRKFMSGKTPESFLQPQHWMRYALEHPNEPIGPFLVNEAEQPARRERVRVSKIALAKN
jgi:transcriptional regulator with XRE-family HTH domain